MGSALSGYIAASNSLQCLQQTWTASARLNNGSEHGCRSATAHACRSPPLPPKRTHEATTNNSNKKHTGIPTCMTNGCQAALHRCPRAHQVNNAG